MGEVVVEVMEGVEVMGVGMVEVTAEVTEEVMEEVTVEVMEEVTEDTGWVTEVIMEEAVAGEEVRSTMPQTTADMA